MNVTARKIGFSQLVSGEGENRLASIEFTVRAGLVEKATLESKGRLEEVQRGGNVRHVNDDVTELHRRKRALSTAKPRAADQTVRNASRDVP